MSSKLPSLRTFKRRYTYQGECIGTNVADLAVSFDVEIRANARYEQVTFYVKRHFYSKYPTQIFSSYIMFMFIYYII